MWLSPRLCLLVALMFFTVRAAFGADPVIARFDEPQRPKDWVVNFGHWEPKDGVLVCRQLDKDNHPAASRWQIPLKDAVIKLRVKFAGATGFHLGFDPAPGELNKQGHLYSLVLTPTQAQLKKHKNKADTASRDETLATATFAAISGEWIDVELKTEGTKVTVTLNATPNATTKLMARLEATDATFAVAKPAVVFRVIGGDVLLDDVQVTVLKSAEIKPAVKKAARKD